MPKWLTSLSVYHPKRQSHIVKFAIEPLVLLVSLIDANKENTECPSVRYMGKLCEWRVNEKCWLDHWVPTIFQLVNWLQIAGVASILQAWILSQSTLLVLLFLHRVPSPFTSVFFLVGFPFFHVKKLLRPAEGSITSHNLSVAFVVSEDYTMVRLKWFQWLGSCGCTWFNNNVFCPKLSFKERNFLSFPDIDQRSSSLDLESSWSMLMAIFGIYNWFSS